MRRCASPPRCRPRSAGSRSARSCPPARRPRPRDGSGGRGGGGPGAPRRVGAGGRRGGPAHRRPGRRRGLRPGRLRQRAVGVGGARGARPARAWLTTVARRRAMDLIRRRDTLRAKLPLLADPGPVAPAAGEAGSGEVIPDDRLQLIFTCCHPALAVDARVALTLRLLCGLTTAEVAHAFLTGEATMAARITRAKKKITAARIPYRIPRPDQLPDRLAAVLDVVHLVFATGHTAPAGTALQRRDLAERALDLARMLRLLLPGDPGVAGLLALILLTDARRHARTGPGGRLLVLADQDRDAWDHGEISEGLALARQALAHRPYTRYPLMAAIAATHATAPRFEATDWAQILALYDQLIAIWPSPSWPSTAPSPSARPAGPPP